MMAAPLVRKPPRSRLELRRNLVHIVLIVVSLFYMFPFMWMFGGSLKTSGEFYTSGLSIFPRVAQWHNYADAWRIANFGTYFVNTLTVALGTTALVLLLSSAAGYVLSRTEFPGKRGVYGVMAALFFLPGGYTVIPLFDVVQKLGLLNNLWGLILVLSAGGLMYNSVLFAGYFSTLPRELEESAMLDGANLLIIYWKVALPQALPMAATVALFTFMGSWNAFFIPLILTIGNPKLRTLAVGMQAFVGENQTQWTWICAGAVITIAPVMLLFFFLQRYFIQAIAGAVKG